MAETKSALVRCGLNLCHVLGDFCFACCSFFRALFSVFFFFKVFRCDKTLTSFFNIIIVVINTPDSVVCPPPLCHGLAWKRKAFDERGLCLLERYRLLDSCLCWAYVYIYMYIYVYVLPNSFFLFPSVCFIALFRSIFAKYCAQFFFFPLSFFFFL